MSTVEIAFVFFLVYIVVGVAISPAMEKYGDIKFPYGVLFWGFSFAFFIIMMLLWIVLIPFRWFWKSL